ncbi:hypothetical protein JOL62DRAFT_27790 [Phyllosticta paracitricarpa]|uniref:Uncharacterized protein n=1 Tax=Phyllosticta paracitricarpa TaxID=2016321 RepID=A0ABR1NBC1_9PEZI
MRRLERGLKTGFRVLVGSRQDVGAIWMQTDRISAPTPPRPDEGSQNWHCGWPSRLAAGGSVERRVAAAEFWLGWSRQAIDEEARNGVPLSEENGLQRRVSISATTGSGMEQYQASSKKELDGDEEGTEGREVWRCKGVCERNRWEGVDGAAGTTLHAADQGCEMHKDQRRAPPEPAPCKARKTDARAKNEKKKKIKNKK